MIADGPSVNNHRDFPQSTVKLPSNRMLFVDLYPIVAQPL